MIHLHSENSDILALIEKSGIRSSPRAVT